MNNKWYLYILITSLVGTLIAMEGEAIVLQTFSKCIVSPERGDDLLSLLGISSDIWCDRILPLTISHDVLYKVLRNIGALRGTNRSLHRLLHDKRAIFNCLKNAKLSGALTEDASKMILSYLITTLSKQEKVEANAAALLKLACRGVSELLVYKLIRYLAEPGASSSALPAPKDAFSLKRFMLIGTSKQRGACAHLIARALGAPIVEGDTQSWSFLVKSGEAVRDLFSDACDKARRDVSKKAVLFIDNIAALDERSDHADECKKALRKQLGTIDNSHLFLITATQASDGVSQPFFVCLGDKITINEVSNL